MCIFQYMLMYMYVGAYVYNKFDNYIHDQVYNLCIGIFPVVTMLMCSGHSNKNLGKCVERITPKRPKGCVCADKRGHSWKNHCGCVNSSVMLNWIKSANMKLLIMAGERKDPDCYRNWLDALSSCIFENKHGRKLRSSRRC